MIKKERKKPLTMLKLEALLRRISDTHPQKSLIEKDYAKLNAGYKGEQSLDYYFSFLPDKKYFIFHDVRLFLNDHYFQMDSLLVSPNFILLLEIKNISGTLFFDTLFNQLIRTHNGKEDGFLNPLSQIHSQQKQLQKWLTLMKLPSIPIQSLVIISNPSTIIKTTSNPNTQRTKKVIHSIDLLPKVEELEAKFTEPKLTPKDIRRLNTTLLKNHTPQSVDILKRYSLSEDELIKGVHCPACNFIPMKKNNTLWICSNCDHQSKDAHVPSIVDYRLLLRETITNSQLREFLKLKSRSSALYILNSLQLEHNGLKRGRVYQLSNLDLWI